MHSNEGCILTKHKETDKHYKEKNNSGIPFSRVYQLRAAGHGLRTFYKAHTGQRQLQEG